MVIIQDKGRSNQSTILPIVGKVSFDKDGLAEVESEEIANKISTIVEGIVVLEDKKEESEKKNSLDSSNVKEADDEKEKFIEKIMDMRKADLQMLAKKYTEKNNLPKSEWFSKNKAKLQDYLISKLYQ